MKITNPRLLILPAFLLIMVLTIVWAQNLMAQSPIVATNAKNLTATPPS